jgi:hypothetical protein
VTTEQLFPEFHMAASAGLAAHGDSLRLVLSAIHQADDDAAAMSAVRSRCTG